MAERERRPSFFAPHTIDTTQVLTHVEGSGSQCGPSITWDSEELGKPLPHRLVAVCLRSVSVIVFGRRDITYLGLCFPLNPSVVQVSRRKNRMIS